MVWISRRKHLRNRNATHNPLAAWFKKDPVNSLDVCCVVKELRSA
jgi:hypothetical protein